MSIMELLKQAQGGDGLGKLADQFGLDAGKAGELTDLLGPVIGRATRQQAEGGGLEDILGALKGEAQAGNFDDAGLAASPGGQAQGQAFLQSIMGGSQSEGLAQEAAQRTGIDLSTVQSFLPALAAMAQGGLQKSMPDAALDTMATPASGGGLMGMIGGLLGGKSGGQGPDLSMLTQMLDADGDGSVVDDLMAKLGK